MKNLIPKPIILFMREKSIVDKEGEKFLYRLMNPYTVTNNRTKQGAPIITSAKTDSGTPSV